LYEILNRRTGFPARLRFARELDGLGSPSYSQDISLADADCLRFTRPDPLVLLFCKGSSRFRPVVRKVFTCKPNEIPRGLCGSVR
jgi:hypothetical protein